MIVLSTPATAAAAATVTTTLLLPLFLSSLLLSSLQLGADAFGVAERSLTSSASSSSSSKKNFLKQGRNLLKRQIFGGGKRSRRRRTPAQSSCTLEAVVYAPEWEKQQGEDGDSDASAGGGPYAVEYTGLDDRISGAGAADGSTALPHPSYGNDELAVAIAESLPRKYGLAGLAKIAVAYAPSQQGLRLKNVLDVQASSLDLTNGRLDLQATVEDGIGGCVALHIPLEFPNKPHFAGEEALTPSPPPPISAADSERFVLDNLRALEDVAAVRLREMEWWEQHREAVEELQKASIIESTSTVSWWVDAGPKLEPACSSMLSLLREDDFAAEVHALAIQQLDYMTTQSRTPEQRSSDESWTSTTTTSLPQVEHATVVAVGPAGLLLRAQTSMLELLPDDATAASAAAARERDVVDIPVRFSRVVNHGDDVQAEILQLTERATEYSHDDFLRQQWEAATAAAAQQEEEVQPVEERLETIQEEVEQEQLQVEPTPRKDSVLSQRALEATAPVGIAVAPSADQEDKMTVGGVEVSVGGLPAKDATAGQGGEEESVAAGSALFKDLDPEEREAALAARYAAIPDLGDRAYQILVDLGMI